MPGPGSRSFVAALLLACSLVAYADAVTDRAKDMLARFEAWSATLQPRGPLFKDAVEADD